ncbi:caspase, EACC1-associated type [Streptomyces sp. 6N223]|uniref:caspase, EACC1-associated type n=1 Tax=Streptomyces sp. 6N223 TaxID=3457412 RepID=UPI003FD55AA3
MDGPQGRRAALLVANGAYDSPAFRPLRSPRQDCEGLAAVLGDPAVGGFGVERLVDATSYEVRRALERFFRGRGRDDVLLLHLSCHGIKDDEGHLHFAVSDTDMEFPASTAVSAAFLHELMERCRARTVVVLLDCCYSGAFLPGAKGDDYVAVKEELSGRGRVILTATNRTEYAWEGERLQAAEPQPSRFTGALIEGLRTGEADGDGDGRITVAELYHYVYERVRREGARQTPRMWADVEYQVTLARVGIRAAPVLPEPEPVPVPVPVPVPPQPVESPEELRRKRQELASLMERLHARRLKAALGGGGGLQRGQDALIRLDLVLAEAALGTTKEIQVSAAVTCDRCDGAGAVLEAPLVTCPRCHGRDPVKMGTYMPAHQLDTGPKPCRVCDGSGLVRPPCPTCAGHGRVPHRRSFALTVPAGVRSGTRIKVGGYGEMGPGGGPPGDLYVEVRELPHPELERRGDDLHLTRRISRRLSRQGGTIEVPTLEGVRTVPIPPGQRTGTLRLPGLGARRLGAGDGGRGDLLVHVQVRWF